MPRARRRNATLAAFLLFAASVSAIPASGSPSTDEPGAIVVFPLVETSGDVDTEFQLTNNSGTRTFARCFYIDGRTDRPGTQSWLVTDFQTTLTQEQPTIWVAGQGLPAVPPDRPDDLYPGPIPPVPSDFIGELRCIVVDESERPIGKNTLTGQATLVNRATGDVRKYKGITFRGAAENDGNNTLLLNDQEYAACPRFLLVNHFFDAAPDPISAVPLATTLTFVPCSMDLENAVPGESALVFDVFNEFEQRLSRSLSITCFRRIELSRIDRSSQPELSIFHYALQGTLVGVSRIRSSVDAKDETGHGVLAVLEEYRGETAAAVNVHHVGGQLQTDVIVLPDPF